MFISENLSELAKMILMMSMCITICTWRSCTAMQLVCNSVAWRCVDNLFRVKIKTDFIRRIRYIKNKTRTKNYEQSKLKNRKSIHSLPFHSVIFKKNMNKLLTQPNTQNITQRKLAMSEVTFRKHISKNSRLFFLKKKI